MVASADTREVPMAEGREFACAHGLLKRWCVRDSRHMRISW